MSSCFFISLIRLSLIQECPGKRSLFPIQEQLTKTLQECVSYISSSLKLKDNNQKIRFTLFIPSKDGDHINLHKIASSIDGVKGLVLPAKSTVAGYALIRKQVISIKDTAFISDRYYTFPRREQSIRSLMAIPTAENDENGNNEILGVLSMDSIIPDFLVNKNKDFFVRFGKLMQNMFLSHLLFCYLSFKNGSEQMAEDRLQPPLRRQTKDACDKGKKKAAV